MSLQLYSLFLCLLYFLLCAVCSFVIGSSLCSILLSVCLVIRFHSIPHKCSFLSFGSVGEYETNVWFTFILLRRTSLLLDSETSIVVFISCSANWLGLIVRGALPQTMFSMHNVLSVFAAVLRNQSWLCCPQRIWRWCWLVLSSRWLLQLSKFTTKSYHARLITAAWVVASAIDGVISEQMFINGACLHCAIFL